MQCGRPVIASPARLVASRGGNTIFRAKIDLGPGLGQGLGRGLGPEHAATGSRAERPGCLTPIPAAIAEEATRMFISPAHAQGIGGGSDFFIQLVPILLMFVIFYLLLLRPQQQRAKAHKEMVANLRRGDWVVTSGGIVGKVTKVRDDSEIEVEIAENTRVRVIRSTVAEVRVKGEPAKETA